MTSPICVLADDDDCQYEGKCHPAATCTDLEGGYECRCPEGMTGDGKVACGKYVEGG